jgi:hypothetical protein
MALFLQVAFAAGFGPTIVYRARASPCSKICLELPDAELAGATPPLGFWDPLNFSEGASEGRMLFYREVEIKHGRVAMLAAVGFPVAEQLHPLFGGRIDVPSYIAFQATPLQTFWGSVLFLLSLLEVAARAVFSCVPPELRPVSCAADSINRVLRFSSQRHLVTHFQ